MGGGVVGCDVVYCNRFIIISCSSLYCIEFRFGYSRGSYSWIGSQFTGDENQFTMQYLVAPPPPDMPYSEFLKIPSSFLIPLSLFAY